MAVTTMVFYGRLKNACRGYMFKGQCWVSLSRWVRVGCDSADGNARYFAGSLWEEYRGRAHVRLTPILAYYFNI